MYSHPSRQRSHLELMTDNNSGCCDGCCKKIGITVMSICMLSGVAFWGLAAKALVSSGGSLSDASISVNMF